MCSMKMIKKKNFLKVTIAVLFYFAPLGIRAHSVHRLQRELGAPAALIIPPDSEKRVRAFPAHNCAGEQQPWVRNLNEQSEL